MQNPSIIPMIDKHIDRLETAVENMYRVMLSLSNIQPTLTSNATILENAVYTASNTTQWYNIIKSNANSGLQVVTEE